MLEIACNLDEIEKLKWSFAKNNFDRGGINGPATVGLYFIIMAQRGIANNSFIIACT